MSNKHRHILKLSLTLLLAMALMVTSSCSNRPKGIPSKNDMADVLTDMHRLEAYWTITDGPMKVGNDSIRKVMRQQMLAKHNLTEQQFENALKWYAHNIDDYVEVYDKVQKNLDTQMNDASKRSDEANMTGQVMVTDGDNLWPGLPVYVLRNGSTRTGISFELDAPAGLKQGDLLRWQMGSSGRRSNAKLMLGVDYADGSTAYASRQVSPVERGNMFVNLQTDSTLNIKRVYGVMVYKPERGEVVLVDSIALSIHPTDEHQYQIINTQYKYKRGGDIRRKPQPESAKSQSADSTVKRPAFSTPDLPMTMSPGSMGAGSVPPPAANPRQTSDTRPPSTNLKMRN